MKKRLWLAALILCMAALAGALAFVTVYRPAVVPECCRLHSSAKELDWLRHEYHLSDAQFERIAQLHADYAPRCAAMCQRVGVQRDRLSALIQAAHETSPEVLEALNATAALEAECRQATLSHIYAVAAVMPPGEGRRYIATLSASLVAPSAPGKAGDCGMLHSQ
ncbi:MAG: periplasmic heavy metal sensor [Verrucomicrobiota bacterium]